MDADRVDDGPGGRTPTPDQLRHVELVARVMDAVMVAFLAVYLLICGAIAATAVAVLVGAVPAGVKVEGAPGRWVAGLAFAVAAGAVGVAIVRHGRRVLARLAAAARASAGRPGTD